MMGLSNGVNLFRNMIAYRKPDFEENFNEIIYMGA
jgi:hypothetical protein